ncbi:MAG: exo-alpha-sialidase [Lentisphaerae bacterium]|nr:exo-alpha-sialidase [Lentisphaerota bacterium]MBT5606597.1 exo-alpha-sialidase [Lentisphaerota bacterium]MBT7056242.1 exo-alpha-sialidase [Lentisphaerota bacterium]MBT7847387.1 exo-alpha-sialidase [Lentisphaerota bacterium]
MNTSPGEEYQTAARLYQGIPGIARDEASGRLWASWYSGGRGECGDNHVLVVTSGDDGTTWGEPVLVIDAPGAIRAFDQCLWTAPDGRLFLFYAQADASEKLHDGRWGVWYTVCRDPSRADSPWTAPVRICDGIMMNKPSVLRDGTWLLPVAMWGDKAHGAGVVRSKNNGETFDWIGGAGGGGLEHMIVERQDRSLWMLMRRGEGMAESVSEDGGVSWSKVVAAGVDGPGSRFHIRRLRSGRLLLVNHVGFTREGNRFLEWRSHMTALLSDDDGKTWPHKLLLDERKDVSYPDATETADGQLYIIYDRGRYSDREILMAVIRENDILADAPGPEARLRVLINKATRPRK